MLTRKHKQLLDFLHSQISTHGVCPSFDDMKLHMGLKSKSGIHRMIVALEERGFIRRIPNRARALEIIPKGTREYIQRKTGELDSTSHGLECAVSALLIVKNYPNLMEQPTLDLIALSGFADAALQKIKKIRGAA